MDVIRDAADAFGNAVQANNRASNVLVQTFLTVRINRWNAIFGAKDCVVVEAEKC